MTSERYKEIDNATTENPVVLTQEETSELYKQNGARFQMRVGAGHYILTPVEGSPADKAIKLRDKGLSNAAISKELGISENSVRHAVKSI